MKLTSDYTPVLNRLRSAHRAAAADTLDEVRGRQARRTGRLANGIRIAELPTRGDVARLALTNDVVYADAVERGANARASASVKAGTKRRRVKGETVAGPVFNRASRRGPHMQGNHVIADAGPHFLGHMSQRLRAGL